MTQFKKNVFNKNYSEYVEYEILRIREELTLLDNIKDSKVINPQ